MSKKLLKIEECRLVPDPGEIKVCVFLVNYRVKLSLYFNLLSFIFVIIAYKRRTATLTTLVPSLILGSDLVTCAI